MKEYKISIEAMAAKVGKVWKNKSTGNTHYNYLAVLVAIAERLEEIAKQVERLNAIAKQVERLNARKYSVR